MSRKVAVSSLLFVMLWLGHPLQAQVTDTLSPSLMRRLAEAVDGYRTGQPVYVVAQRGQPHNVVGVFSTRAEALRTALPYGRTYGVFGPFVAPVDPELDRRPRVREIMVTIQTATGLQRVRIDPATTDALFWSPAALDKFCFRHYQGFMEPAALVAFQDSLMAGFNRFGLVGHVLWTLCEPVPPTGGLIGPR